MAKESVTLTSNSESELSWALKMTWTFSYPQYIQSNMHTFFISFAFSSLSVISSDCPSASEGKLTVEKSEAWVSDYIYVHYGDVIMGAIASQFTSITIVYSTVYSDADQRKHQSSASLAFVRGIHRGPVIFTYKWPVTWKIFPFDDVIMFMGCSSMPNIKSGLT